MRKTIAIILFVMAVSAAGAQEAKTVKMKDVPDEHWAASAVYDLIKLGVTRGYPDGTFRGNRPITDCLPIPC